MYYSDQAIILTRKIWREDDLLITAYSENFGKLILQARGGKKILSKLAGHLEPVSLSYLNMVRGKNIDQLIGAEVLDGYWSVKQSINRIVAAGWLVNLINKMVLEKHPDRRMFFLIKHYLDFLNRNENNIDLASLAVGFKLWHLLGLNPSLKQARWQREIEFVVKNGLADIFKNKTIVNQKEAFKQILAQEIKEHLNN
ncbi:MAG TPA: DNA repair protein RecO [bacterium]|nr:DNA repair protein RecO [bacterium]HPL95810.1 DNA repair protein RecO [bacterium]